MSEAFLNVVNMSISAGWLVLAVLALRLLLKKAPKWVNVLLWGIVAVRLLCPFSIESALSLIPSAQTISPSVLLDTPEINTGFPAINSAINPMIQSAVSVIEPEKGISTFKYLIGISSWVWFIGVVVLLAYGALSYLRLRHQVRIATILRENIYQCVTVDSPFVLGLLKPRIYLPYDMDDLSISHVVAHEQAHIRRHDHWWKPLGFFLLTVHWFNPLMWLAYCFLCRDIELACDEKVIRSLEKEQRADYTQALVSCSVNRLRIAACPLAFGEVGVKERVKNVMNYKKPGFWILVFAVVVCIAVAVCFLTDPVTTVRNPWVQEYVPGAEGIRGNVDKARYESISPDFAIGADQYGRAVFKDPHQAFETFRIVCKDAIRIIQKEHNLPPISEATYPVYKTYGWQTSSETVDTAFVTAFLDLYENSFTKEVPPELDPPATKPEPEVTVWFDYLENPEQMQWDGRLEIDLPAFPDVTFRWYPEKIEAVTENGIIPLYTGMPIWNTYFCDLTGDGLPELCSSISFGSGMIDDHIIIYDYQNAVSYELSDRGFFDYTLRMNDADGQLYVDKRTYAGGGIVVSGRLVFRDGGFQILGEVTTPSIADITDPTKDESFSYDTAMERFYEDSLNVYYFSGAYSQYVIVHYTDGTSENICAALENGRATLADLERFGIRYWAEPKTDPLDEAISQAILAHYASDEPDGLIHAESHVVLASEGMSGTPVFDAGTHVESVTLYLLVYHGKYSTYGRALEQVGGSYGAASITFSVSESGTYTLEEYWIPRDGGYYDDDIRSRFPGVSADDALNSQAYLEGLKEENYQKALAYLYSTASVDERIDGLLAEIQTAPAHSSNPGDYIRAHESEYAELVGYGEFTLRYCFTAFLQGGQTDLRSHIMALACQDIIRVWGEQVIPLENIVMTGQDWFDGFYGYAQVLAKNYSAEELQKHYPVTFLLLQMTDGLH